MSAFRTEFNNLTSPANRSLFVFEVVHTLEDTGLPVYRFIFSGRM